MTQRAYNDWAGELPDYWKSLPLRRIAVRYSGGTPSKSEPLYWDGGTVPWLNSGAVNQRIIRKPSAYITEAGLKNSSAKWVHRGAIVMALAGQGKTKASVALMEIDATCNQSMTAIVPGRGMLSKYLFYWLDCQYGNIRGLAADEARDGLNLEMVGSIPCPIPPLEVQESIVSFLDQRTAAIDRLVGTGRKDTASDGLLGLQAVKLNEYRRALITAAVTGKIDVTAETSGSA